MGKAPAPIPSDVVDRLRLLIKKALQVPSNRSGPAHGGWIHGRVIAILSDIVEHYDVTPLAIRRSLVCPRCGEAAVGSLHASGCAPVPSIGADAADVESEVAAPLPAALDSGSRRPRPSAPRNLAQTTGLAPTDAPTGFNRP